jgi:hypothetical protein
MGDHRNSYPKTWDFLMKNLMSVLLAVSVFGAAACADSLGRAAAESHPNSLTMTCAQVQDYIKRHGQTLLTTGKELGNYSFNYADCGGTVPGFACTMNEAYCYVGWWCDYNYPVAVNPNVHDQGTEFCPTLRSGTR